MCRSDTYDIILLEVIKFFETSTTERTPGSEQSLHQFVS